MLDCAVIAVPSDLGEDEVKAYVLPRDGIKLQPEDIIYWCADNLAYFKCPRYIELREDLPRTPSYGFGRMCCGKNEMTWFRGVSTGNRQG
ncbi:MAG: hypothetical protein Ct9H300mP27_12610 [Chloroflexota bacterium]|nr:MAG: hypothetical protein Ct9H300mP27_12610 [Chloroflexota bacterium]